MIPSQTLIYVASVAIAAPFAAATVTFLIIAGLFVLRRGHTTPRSWGALLRAALRETLLLLFTQPLLPLYYLRGHRMGGDGPGDPVVFVHGYTQNRSNFLGLARALSAAKIAPLHGFNYSWAADLEGSAKRLARFVERVVRETGRPHVSLVAHSMGGLVCLEYMHTPEGAARVRKCVTIATPHAGIAWRGPTLGKSGAQMRMDGEYLRDRKGRVIAVPTLSIYSAHDNLVHPPSTSALAARGGRDHQVFGLGHLSILFDPEVYDQVVRFLADPSVEYPADQSAIGAP